MLEKGSGAVALLANSFCYIRKQSCRRKKGKSYWRQGLRVPISRVCDCPLPPGQVKGSTALGQSRAEQNRTVSDCEAEQ